MRVAASGRPETSAAPAVSTAPVALSTQRGWRLRPRALLLPSARARLRYATSTASYARHIAA